MSIKRKIIIVVSLLSVLAISLSVPCFANASYSYQNVLAVSRGNAPSHLLVYNNTYVTEVSSVGTQFPVNTSTINVTMNSLSSSPTGTVDAMDWRLASRVFSTGTAKQNLDSPLGYIAYSSFGQSLNDVDYYPNGTFNAYNSPFPFGGYIDSQYQPTGYVTKYRGLIPFKCTSMRIYHDYYYFDGDVSNDIRSLNVNYFIEIPIDDTLGLDDDSIAQLIRDRLSSYDFYISGQYQYFDSSTLTWVTRGYTKDNCGEITNITYYAEFNSRERDSLMYEVEVMYRPNPTDVPDTVFKKSYGDNEDYFMLRNLWYTPRALPGNALGVANTGGVGYTVLTQDFTSIASTFEILKNNYFAIGDSIINVDFATFDPLEWISNTVGGVLNVEVVPNLPLYVPLLVCISIGVVFAFLKYFAGG